MDEKLPVFGEKKGNLNLFWGTSVPPIEGMRTWRNLEDAVASGATGVFPLWVQVPPSAQ